jgi:hypothetical protein
MAQQILNVLSDETIDYILSKEEVVNAKARIEAKSDNSGSESFTITPSGALLFELSTKFGLQISHVATIPMRWIKGDSPSHHDIGVSTFTHTYLVYLNDSNGSLVVDGVTYPIARGVGYRFSEGLSHETAGTVDDTEPRLLLGPMSETGFAVGEEQFGTSLIYPGGTTIYVRQTVVGETISFSTDLVSWNNLSFPAEVTNSNTPLGLLNIEFVTNIVINNALGGGINYFICRSDSIQFGSTNLKSNGTRPIITIDGVNYAGLINNGLSVSNGYNNIYLMNLEIRAAGGATLANDGGWLGQSYFGKGTTSGSNIVLNCHSTGSIIEYGGGIIGRYAGPLKFTGCSSSGAIAQYGGGIVGSHSPSSGVLHCESCWSSGAIGEYAGGITGMFTGIATIVNCYSTGSIGTHAGGIAGSSSGGNNGTNRFTLSQCYSTGAIGEYGGGIIGRSSGDVHVSNSYSIGYINANASGILGNLEGNTTNKTVSGCYVAGAMAVSGGGYVMPGYTNLTGSVVVQGGTVTLSNNFAEASISSSGWNTARANNVLTGVPASASAPIGVKWVYTGLNTPYEILVMGFTPYARTVVAGSPPAMVQSFSSSVVAGVSTAPALIIGRSYSILRITGGDGTYSLISVNGTTGSIQTSRATAPGVYTVMIRNNGSYHITTYTLTVTPYTPHSMFGMFTNNAQVYYKSHSLASGGVGGVRNHRRKARKT